MQILSQFSLDNLIEHSHMVEAKNYLEKKKKKINNENMKL